MILKTLIATTPPLVVTILSRNKTVRLFEYLATCHCHINNFIYLGANIVPKLTSVDKTSLEQSPSSGLNVENTSVSEFYR